MCIQRLLCNVWIVAESLYHDTKVIVGDVLGSYASLATLWFPPLILILTDAISVSQLRLHSYLRSDSKPEHVFHEYTLATPAAVAR